MDGSLGNCTHIIYGLEAYGIKIFLNKAYIFSRNGSIQVCSLNDNEDILLNCVDTYNAGLPGIDGLSIVGY